MDEIIENYVYAEYNGESVLCHKDDVKYLIKWMHHLKIDKNRLTICTEKTETDCHMVSCTKCPFCINCYRTTQTKKKEAIQKLYDTFCKTSVRGNILSKSKAIKLFN